ncbi:MAG TPA: 4Fe-4S binding protein [Symbiobacteriaceae bacterium]
MQTHSQTSDQVQVTPGIDLYRSGMMRFLFTNKYVQPVIQILSVALFFLAIYKTFAGPQDVNRNAGSIAFFNLWWSPVMVISLVLFGRIWCYVCPVGAITEFLQRFSLNRRFPIFSKPKWQVAGLSLSILAITVPTFVVARVFLYKFGVTSTPWKAGVYFLVCLVVAAATTLLFRQRAFCRYICPATGVMSATAKLSPIEFLQDRDTAVPNCMTAEFKSNYLSTDRRCVSCMNCTVGQPDTPVYMRFRWPGAGAVEQKIPLVEEALLSLIIWAVFPIDHILGSTLAATAAIKALPYVLAKSVPYLISITAAILAFALINKTAALWSGLDVRTAFIRFAAAYTPLGITFSLLGQAIAGLMKNGGTVLNVIAKGLGIPLHLRGAWASAHTISVWSHLSDTWFLWLAVLWGAIIALQIAREMGKTKAAVLKAFLPHLALMSASTYVVMIKMVQMHSK